MDIFKSLPTLAQHKYKINYVTGDFELAVNDYAQRDILSDFVISRTYNSLSREWKFSIGKQKKIVLKTSREIFLTYEGNHLVAIKDEIGRTTRYEYEKNFLKSVIYPDGSRVRYACDFDKNIISCTERDGKIIFQNEYDYIGRIVKMKDAAGARDFFYDTQNRRVIESGKGLVIYKWNRRKLIDEIIFEDGSSEQFFYDTHDKLNYKRGRGGEEHFWTYSNGFLRREIFPNGLIKKFEYDKEGNVIRTIDSDGHEELFSYSTKNLLIEKRTRLNVKDWRVETWERDIVGRILKYKVNDQTVNYFYDEDSPVPTLIQTPCGYKFSYRYDATYKLLVMKTELGEISFTYNQLNEPVDYRKIFAETESPKKLFKKAEYEIFDEGDRRIEARDKIGDKYKLMRWKYDKNDNCVEWREWKNLQSKTGATGKVFIERFEYDAQNRLTKKSNGEGFTEYSYDCLNRLVRQKFQVANQPARIKKFFYNFEGQLISTNEYEVK